MNKKKVIILMPVAEQRGGAEVALNHLMQYGQQPGMEWLIIFTEEGPMIAQMAALGVPTRLVLAGQLRSPRHFAATVAQIAAIARQEKADAILSWMGKPHLYGSLAARRAGIPALWYQHGPASHWIDRLATRLPARGILACSQSSADAQARLRPVRPLRVVHPGVDLGHFDPAVLPCPVDIRRKLNLPTRGPLIGSVGRLQRWKGMHVLIEAMPAVRAVHPEAHCVLVGGTHSREPEYPDYLKERIAALDLQQNVTLVGLQHNIPEWMQAMDVIVHAADNEPFGIVVIEAMALGKPVVAGSRGGPTEIITDGVNGLLTAYGDEAQLSRAILRYLEDAALALRSGEAARIRANEFSSQRYAQKVVTAVQDLLYAA